MCCDLDTTLLTTDDEASLILAKDIYSIEKDSANDLEVFDNVVKELQQQMESIDTTLCETSSSIKSMSEIILYIKKQIESITEEMKKLSDKNDLIENELNEVLVNLDTNKSYAFTTGVITSQCDSARVLIRINNNHFQDKNIYIIFRTIDGKNNIRSTNSIVLKANSIEEFKYDKLDKLYEIEFFEVSEQIQIRVFELGTCNNSYCKSISLKRIEGKF